MKSIIHLPYITPAQNIMQNHKIKNKKHAEGILEEVLKLTIWSLNIIILIYPLQINVCLVYL